MGASRKEEVFSSQVDRLIPPKNVVYMVFDAGSNICIRAQEYELIFCSKESSCGVVVESQ